MNIAKLQGKFNKAYISTRYIDKDLHEKSTYQSISYEIFEGKYEKIIKPAVEKHILENH